tara:strand:- start:205 stop:567 length:363 start_codon:yes stop_codon:yes gene_type:complete
MSIAVRNNKSVAATKYDDCGISTTVKLNTDTGAYEVITSSNYPARLDKSQTARCLGVTERDLRALAVYKILLPLGCKTTKDIQAGQHSYYAYIDVVTLMSCPASMHKMQAAIKRYNNEHR